MATTTNVSPLIINYLTQAQYDAALLNNTINANELYLTPESASSISIATETTGGIVKPWYYHTTASIGLTAGNNSDTIVVNGITTDAGKYYAIESDVDGRMFVNIPWSNDDTKNTAGSTNSTSKLYLIGATSQDTNPTTNSYQYTYTDNGLFSALKLGLNLNGTEKAHLEWNDTDKSIDFIFN